MVKNSLVASGMGLNKYKESCIYMKPTFIFKFLQYEISLNSYSLFMVIGVVFAIFISIYNIKQAGLSIKSSLLCFLPMVIGILIGARFLNVVLNWDYYMINTHRIFTLNTSGFSLMGGLILASILGLVSAKLLQLNYWKLGDSISPGLGIGLILMRTGCFLNGCCYGLPTNHPWAVRFPYNSLAHRYYLSKSDLSKDFSLFKSFASPNIHPTQIYEIIGIALATILAIILIKRKVSNGVSILSFSIIFTITRLINHFFRVHPDTNVISFLFYPIFYTVIIILLSTLLYKRINTRKL